MKVVILGGGISGLSGAYYARKKYPKAEIFLFEKEKRLGGAMATSFEGGFLFEKGPRTFPLGRSPHLLSLIEDLGLSDELIFSKPLPKFILINDKLTSTATLFFKMIGPILREPFRTRGNSEDESIYDFSIRRFGPKITNMLIEPLAIGIFGEDIRKLSLNFCFPQFAAWEKKYGSIVVGSLFSKKKKRGLFTLRNGMDTLISELARKCQAEIFLDSPIDAIERNGVLAKGKFYPADLILSALSGSAIGKITGLWPDFPETHLTVIHAAYHHNVTPKQGFGYLVPSSEGDNLLGVVWDSSIFPEQNQQNETRMTAILKKTPDDFMEDAAFKITHQATLPHFFVGYEKRLSRFQAEIGKHYPNLLLLGNYIQGASVDSCISLSNKALLCKLET